MSIDEKVLNELPPRHRNVVLVLSNLIKNYQKYSETQYEKDQVCVVAEGFIRKSFKSPIMRSYYTNLFYNIIKGE